MNDDYQNVIDFFKKIEVDELLIDLDLACCYSDIDSYNKLQKLLKQFAIYQLKLTKTKPALLRK